MTSPFIKDFVKLRHRSWLFIESNVAALQSALDINDLLSLVFLMCKSDQIGNMYNLFSTTDFNGVASLNLYSLFQTFPEWEQKLPEALGAIKNKLALLKLGISPKDLHYTRIIKNSELALCPTRVALYRIVDELTVQGGKNLISKMVESGLSQPPRFPHLEKITHVELLDFMYWHAQGLLDIGRRESLEKIDRSLNSIDKKELADYFSPPQVLLDSYVFDNHPLEVYRIKNPKTPGLCVIINQVKYGGKKADRDSSIANVMDLVRVMENLNFSVVTIEDLAEPVFCHRIKTTIESNFSEDHSIFIMIIMGHGERDGVLCPSGKLESKEEGNHSTSVVRIEEIQHTLFECKELETIPKVLILNACRGEGQFTTRPYFQMAADEADRSEILSHMDIITCYSALPKFVSWRDNKAGKGSLYINVFCDVLTQRPDIEICELFTLMNARLMQPTADLSEAFTPGRIGYEKRIALPFDFTSSLRKKLYLKLPD